mmetsp:Transcript_13004/g.42581  ORF Transcript_13004/g.42581 Transcript_13004/m.42581 type:complete len:258 (-) Transcript_13004:916-1689(-)
MARASASVASISNTPRIFRKAPEDTYSWPYGSKARKTLVRTVWPFSYAGVWSATRVRSACSISASRFTLGPRRRLDVPEAEETPAQEASVRVGEDGCLAASSARRSRKLAQALEPTAFAAELGAAPPTPGVPELARRAARSLAPPKEGSAGGAGGGPVPKIAARSRVATACCATRSLPPSGALPPPAPPLAEAADPTMQLLPSLDRASSTAASESAPELNPATCARGGVRGNGARCSDESHAVRAPPLGFCLTRGPG